MQRASTGKQNCREHWETQMLKGRVECASLKTVVAHTHVCCNFRLKGGNHAVLCVLPYLAPQHSLVAARGSCLRALGCRLPMVVLPCLLGSLGILVGSLAWSGHQACQQGPWEVKAGLFLFQCNPCQLRGSLPPQGYSFPCSLWTRPPPGV